MVRAFDAYLNRLDSYRDSLQNPIKQKKEEVDKAMEELLPAKGGKFTLKTRFQEYISQEKKKLPSSKEPSPKEKGLLCFYLFLRLLDAKEISKLQHEFVKYRCSLKSRKMYNHRDNVNYDQILPMLEELEELMELVRYTIPSILPVNLSGKAESAYKTMIQRHFSDFFQGKDKDSIFKNLYYQSDGETPIPRKHMTMLVRSAPLPLYQEMFKKYYCISNEDFHEYSKLSKEIEENQTQLVKLHKKLESIKVQKHKIIPKKDKPFNVHFVNEEHANWMEEYEDTLKKVEQYKILRRKLTFESLYEIFQIHVNITARLVAFAQDWERDMFFLLLALSYGKYITCNEKEIKDMFSGGRVVFSLTKESSTLRSDHKLLYELCWHKSREDENLNKIINEKIEIRNCIAHLNHFTQSRRDDLPLPSLEEIINKVRDMLCYDRKRQNAVTKAIKDLLMKENHITINWKSSTENTGQYVVKPVKDIPLIHLKHLCIKEKDKVDEKACMYDKQEAWLHKGIQEAAHDSNFLKCVNRLIDFSYNKV